MLWDSHCHIAAWQSEEERDEVVFRARVAGVTAALAIASGPADWQRTAEEALYTAQLELARELELPVVLHCYKSAGRLLHGLKYHGEGLRGIVHAFNGSELERQSFRRRGFVLGFGPTITYEGSVRIRRHLTEVDAEGWVLETDSPFMLTARRRAGGDQRGEPSDLKEILHAASRIRGLTESEAADRSTDNLLRVLNYGERLRSL